MPLLAEQLITAIFGVTFFLKKSDKRIMQLKTERQQVSDTFVHTITH